jgi:hypothetical protein
MSAKVPSEPRYISVDDFDPAFCSVMIRAAICGKLGPPLKFNFALKP